MANYRNEYLKYDEKVNLCVYIWEPSGQVKGTIQIAHGMAEHLARYDAFGTKYAKMGYLVIGADHYAHGLSVKEVKDIGVVTDYDFMDTILGSIKAVRSHYESLFGSNNILFAHSMGSMACQRYIELYPDDFNKVIISGTDYPFGKYAFAKILTSSSGKTGKIKYSKFIDNLGVGSFNKKFNKEYPKVAWLSSNKENYLAYEKDPLSGAMFPNNYYHSLAEMLLLSKKKEERAKISKELKILIIAGSNDPVGGFGKGPTKLYNDYEKLLSKDNVQLTLLENGRHECLNEVSPIRDAFLSTIDAFIE